MADIAIIFHWPLSEIAQLELAELVGWRARAVDRWNHINKGE